MPLYLILAAGTPMLACLTANRPKPHSRGQALNGVCLLAIGAALFLVSALRYDVGNDYYWYTDIMHEALYHGHVPTEAGFNVLVRIVYGLSGSENYLFVFALFSFATVFFFLDALYRYSVDFALSFTMFILLGFYFQSFSTVRYYAVLPLAFYALRFCERGDWPRFLFVVCAGALFHKSILSVLLFYPLARLKWQKKALIPALAACALVAAFPSFWTAVAVRLYPTYRNVAFDRGEPNLPNILRCVLVLAFVLYCGRTYLADGASAGEAVSADVSADGSVVAGGGTGKDVICPGEEAIRHMRIWTKLSVMGLAFYLCAWFLPQISRIAFYLTLPQLLLVPAVTDTIADARKRRVMKALIVFCCLLYFARYMAHAADDGIKVLPYRTFLFSERTY